MIERFSDPVTFHGEGPVWIDGLRVVDMLAGDIVTLDADGAVRERLHVGEVAAALRPRRHGGLVVALERGFALVGPDGGLEVLPDVWSDPGVRMNDGGTDPGRPLLLRLDGLRHVCTSRRAFPAHPGW